MTAIVKIQKNYNLAALITNGLVQCEIFFTSFKIVEDSLFFKRVEFYNKKTSVGFIIADKIEMVD